MGDASHSFGQDIDLSAGGDMLYVADPTQQRVVKRLLTPLGGDIWNLPYGGGLGSFVGQADAETSIANAIRAQIFQEQTVAQLPEPVIEVTQDATGNVTANIQYTDAATGEQVTLAPLVVSG